MASPDDFLSCYLFNIRPTIPNATVKESLERAVGYPNGIRLVWSDASERYFMVEAENKAVLKALFKRRKNIYIEGNRAVLVFSHKILGGVRLWLESALLSFAYANTGQRLMDRSPFERVKVNLVKDSDTAEWLSIADVDSWKDAVNFVNDMAAVTTGETEQLGPIGMDDPNVCSAIQKKTKPWIAIRMKISEDVLYDMMVGPENPVSMAQQVGGLAVCSNKNLRCVDQRMEKMLVESDREYSTARDTFLEKCPNVTAGRVVWFYSGAAFVFHAVVDDFDVETDVCQLEGLYSKCIEQANELGLPTLIISPFLPARVKESAESCTAAILSVLTRGKTLPSMLKFVHYDTGIATQFGRVLSESFSTITRSSSGSVKRVTGLTAEDERGKLDVASGYSCNQPEPSKDPDAAVAQWLQSIETPAKKTQSAPKPRAYGKRSEEEKQNKKNRSAKKQHATDRARTRNFVNYLMDEFPSQMWCCICSAAFADDDREQETCQRCYRPYHSECLDKQDVSICLYCWTHFKPTQPDQPEEGRMTVRTVDQSNVSFPGFPDSRGYIRITYSMPSAPASKWSMYDGVLFGTHKVAYLPNTPKGRKVALMLRIAFEHRLIFIIQKSLSLNGDYGLTWNIIPHKTSLTGGRARCGYPDATYLTRVEGILNKLDIATPDDTNE